MTTGNAGNVCAPAPACKTQNQFLVESPLRCNGVHEAFGQSQRIAALLFVEWLRTRPDPDDIAQEIDATLNQLRQLQALEASHA